MRTARPFFALLALISTALAVSDLRTIRSGKPDNPDGPDPLRSGLVVQLRWKAYEDRRI